MLCLLLIHILLKVLFLVIENSDKSNYNDGNTLFSSANTFQKVKSSKVIIFKLHKMVFRKLYCIKLGKSDFKCLSKNTDDETLIFDNTKIKK